MDPSCRGQAALEYAGALLLAAVLLGAAAVVGPFRGVGREVVQGMRHGLCAVTAAVCTAQEARAEGLAPCPLHTRWNTEDARVSLALFRVGRRDALAIERRSDGTATVSFLDGGQLGAEAGIGVSFTPLSLKGSVTASAGVTFNAGRSWDFPTWGAADDFVARYARRETITGEVRDRIEFWDDDAPPPADATWTEGGAFGEAAAELSLPIAGNAIDVDAEIQGVAVLGRRTAGRRRTTYVRVTGTATGHLGAVIGALGTDSAGEAVLELTTDAGRPVELKVAAAAALGARIEAMGATGDLGRLAERLQSARLGASRGNGLAAEAAISLDLRDPLNLEATRALFGSFALPHTVPSRLAALGSRLDSDGTLDLRLYRASAERDETGADAALGLKVGASYDRVERGRDLLAAWTSVGGGVPRERADCTAPA